MPNGIDSVGFIGLGIMGRHMAGHILAGGYKLHIYNRSRGNAGALIAKGAVWHDIAGRAGAGMRCRRHHRRLPGRCRAGLSRSRRAGGEGQARRRANRRHHLEPHARGSYRQGRGGEGCHRARCAGVGRRRGRARRQARDHGRRRQGGLRTGQAGARSDGRQRRAIWAGPAPASTPRWPTRSPSPAP